MKQNGKRVLYAANYPNRFTAKGGIYAERCTMMYKYETATPKPPYQFSSSISSRTRRRMFNFFFVYFSFYFKTFLRVCGCECCCAMLRRLVSLSICGMQANRIKK